MKPSQLFQEYIKKGKVTFNGMDMTVAHHVTALCDSSLRHVSQVTSRLNCHHSFSPTMDTPNEEDGLKRLFQLRLIEFLQGPGIPDHPNARLFSDVVNDETITKEAGNALHRANLFLSAFSSRQDQSLVLKNAIMVKFSTHSIFEKT